MRTAPVFAAFILLSAFSSGTLGAPANAPLNNPAGEPVNGTQACPQLAAIGNKVVALWMDVQPPTTSATQLFNYAVSTDSGATYTDLGAPPAPTTGGTWRWRVDPQIQIHQSTGEVWIAGQLTAPTPTRFGVGLVRGTFSGSTLVWDPPILVRSAASSIGNFPAISLALDQASGDLYILYANFPAVPLQIEFQRSQNHGVTWSAPAVLSSAADAGDVNAPILVLGPNSVMHAAWAGKRTGHRFPLRYRSSIDAGANWSLEQTVGTQIRNSMTPGTQLNQATLSMDANRAAGVTDPGRVAIAWAESWDFDDEPFPSLPATPLVSEAESNDTPATANPFAIGQALTGAFAVTTDVDHWKITLNSGDHILLWQDSTANVQNRVSLIGPDGTDLIGTSFTFNFVALPFAFSAPVAGTYTIRIAPTSTSFTTTGSYYRVRTLASASLPGEARDQRDLVVAHGSVSGATTTWSAPVHFSLTAAGYDDFNPTISWGADGLDYVTWYDFSQGPTPGRSQLVVARNLAGADPFSSPPVNLSAVSTNWSILQFVNPPEMGVYNAITSDSRRVYFGWGDGRTGNPDCLATSILTGVSGGSCPPDTTVTAGTKVVLSVPLTNWNPLFGEKVLFTASGSRAWPVLSSHDSLAAGGQGNVSISIPVPDSAASGVNTVCITATRQSGIPLFNCCVVLHVNGITAVGESSLPDFALDRIAPNPSRGPMALRFALPAAGPVALEVFNVVGARVATVVSGMRLAGTFVENWNARDDRGLRLAPGIYLVRLSARGRSVTRRVVLMR